MKNTLPGLRALLAFTAISACKHETSQEGSAPPPANAHVATVSPDAHATEAQTAPPNTTAIDPSAAATEFRDAAQWLPQGHIAAFQQSGEVTRSNAANLFQIMDGAAPSYERYGLQNFAKTDYRRTGTPLVATIEIYEFSTDLGAFGRYSMMLADGRDPASMQAQGITLGGGGYQGTTQLVFWKGHILAQISITDASDEPNEGAVATAAHESLPQFAEAVSRLVNGTTTVPASPLSHDGLVWGGETYVADSAFGVDQTGPGWIGHYRTATAKRYRLGNLQRASATEAQQTATRLRGPTAVAIHGIGDDAFATTLEGTGEIVVARRGNTVFVIADGGAPGMDSLDRPGKLAVLRTALTQSATPPSVADH